MFKRLMSLMVLLALLSSFAFIQTAYAAVSKGPLYETTKKAPVWSESNSKSKKLHELSTGSLVTIVEIVTNSAGNKWGRCVNSSSWIYMGNLKASNKGLPATGQYKTNKADVPLRYEPASGAKIQKYLAKGELVDVVRTYYNHAGNPWATTADGYEIYLGNLAKYTPSAKSKENSSGKEPAFFVGDTVELNGNYFFTSNGGKAGKYTRGRYIIAKIATGAKYPYAIRPADDKSISGWANEQALIPDYTDDILRGVINEITMLKAFKNSPVQLLAVFYETFKKGGALDIKWEKNWNAKFKHKFREGQQFLFYDMLLTPDQLGNVLYGWIGRMVGIGDTLLYFGGGYAHQANTHPKYTKTKIFSMEVLYDANRFYGDLEDDHVDITRGINMAEYRPPVIDLLDSEGKLIRSSAKVALFFGDVIDSVYILSI